MIIPPPNRTYKALTYPFDKVQVNEPYEIEVAKDKIVSASNSARQYAKRTKKKFVVRTTETGITIYRTK